VTRAHAPAARSFCVATLALFVLLGVAWSWDRSRRWADPRLDTAGFVTIRGEGSPAGERGTWLMAIHPGCPSCMARAREMSASLPQEAHAPRPVFLIVDRRRPPSTADLAELEAETIWWDARDVWRHRWGHRVYGEILRFDSGGRYLGTMPPGSTSPSAPGSEGGEEG